ncbi:MAG: isochorismate synthase [Gemmatimonadales bacterium]|nr:isochorismate synthase [Gemmatimonadales bacterium]MYG49352.1 isochorismate synthase [Gemmatimonadales bacterium]MYK01711.1 isochorismate synthase [Candidatus Palauibacter ramosifaciens]
MKGSRRSRGRRAEEALEAARGAGYFASVTLRLPSIEPEAVLASPSVGVRGFWQSGPRWIAHAGAAAEIDSREGAPGPAPGDLIVWTRERAAKLFAESWVLDLDGDARRPRMHGGFAFDPARRADREPGFWEVFPGARFVLPAYEVEADERGAWLTVTRRFSAGTLRDQAIDRLRRRATRTREQLARLERQGAAPGPVPSATAIEELLDRPQWQRAVDEILEEIRSGRVRKVVLARSIDITLGRLPDSAAVLTALRTANPLAHLYLMQFARDRFLVGAAPELIGSLRGRRFRTMAVGGSTPRGADPASDAWLGRQLLDSRKNREEHLVVVEDIVERLRQVGVRIGAVPKPALLRLPRIQHLRTDLEAETRSGTHILSLVDALHPTAAVCGDPRAGALDIIRAHETESRGWYAGPVGWFDEDGNGEFAPALRGGVARGPLLRLYAAAGLVSDSRAPAEWDETRVKLQTMLAALGVARMR